MSAEDLKSRAQSQTSGGAVQQMNNATDLMKNFEVNLKKYDESIVKLLHQHGITKDQFTVIVVHAVKKVPKLLEVDQRSLFASILTAAEVGLPPNTHQQFAYIIPYAGKAQFQIGYIGLIEVAYRSGFIKSIDSAVTYECDEFIHEIGVVNGENRDRFVYTPNKYLKERNGDRGARTGVWARITLKDNTVKVVSFQDIVVMKHAELYSKGHQDAIRKGTPNESMYSEAKDLQGWNWRKLAIKQALKELPKTPEIQKAIALDNYQDKGGVLHNDTLSDMGSVIEMNLDYETITEGDGTVVVPTTGEVITPEIRQTTTPATPAGDLFKGSSTAKPAK